MKKFIKSRSETSSSQKPVTPDPPPPPDNETKPDWFQLQQLAGVWQDSLVQPPLPAGPPPVQEELHVKLETEDMDYENAQQFFSLKLDHLENVLSDPSMGQSEICRDFIRGTCKREGTCKYAHKHDTSQLEGVYTFCRKFQNSVCTFTNCKYVHATVFEEQHFYRTGYLPPHTLAHKVQNTMLQPPPPPPPPPEDPPMVMPLIDFSNPPPPLMNESMMNRMNVGGMDAHAYLGDMNMQMAGNMGLFAAPPPPAPPCEIPCFKPTPNYCANCKMMQFRLEHNENKLKRSLHSKQLLRKKMERLDKQSVKLRGIISELIRPTILAEPRARR